MRWDAPGGRIARYCEAARSERPGPVKALVAILLYFAAGDIGLLAVALLAGIRSSWGWEALVSFPWLLMVLLAWGLWTRRRWAWTGGLAFFGLLFLGGICGIGGVLIENIDAVRGGGLGALKIVLAGIVLFLGACVGGALPFFILLKIRPWYFLAPPGGGDGGAAPPSSRQGPAGD